jgi:hypothetical protein
LKRSKALNSKNSCPKTRTRKIKPSGRLRLCRGNPAPARYQSAMLKRRGRQATHAHGRRRSCSAGESAWKTLAKNGPVYGSEHPSMRPNKSSNPAIEQGGCPGRGSRTRGEARVRPLNNYPTPKVPCYGPPPFNSSRYRPSFRPRLQQLPQPSFVGVPRRTEQYRAQQPLRRRPLP